jgi:hypothetical protein
MDPALTATLLALGTGAACAFVAYWSGYAHAKREHRATILRLRAQIHEMHLFGLDLADALYRARTGQPTSGLTARERATFHDIATHLRKDAS